MRELVGCNPVNLASTLLTMPPSALNKALKADELIEVKYDT